MEEDVRESELDFHIQKIKDLGFWDQIKVDTFDRDDEEDLVLVDIKSLSNN